MCFISFWKTSAMCINNTRRRYVPLLPKCQSQNNDQWAIILFPLFYKEHLIFSIRLRKHIYSKLLKFTCNTLHHAVTWRTASYKPKSVMICLSPVCWNVHSYSNEIFYEGEDVSYERRRFFRNVYFSFMMIMIVGGVWFLICAKDILNLINNHCNKIFSGCLFFFLFPVTVCI